MSRTPLFSRLKRSLQRAHLKQLIESRELAARKWQHATAPSFSRREWLHVLPALGLGLGCGELPQTSTRSPAPPSRRSAPSARKVAVIGAGLAGLTCAHRLKQRGVHAQLFDASARAGGRVWTSGKGLVGGQLAELGGEFIDSNQTAIRRLVQELGLELDDLLEAQAGTRADTFWFDGAVFDEAEVIRAFQPLAARISRDLEQSEADDAVFGKLDAQSISEYLRAAEALDPRLIELLEVAYVGEYGLEADQQSSFNLLWLIDAGTEQGFRVFGDSDERYHIRGGNQQLIERLQAGLAGQLLLEHRLLQIKQPNRGYQLTFDHGGSRVTAHFDQVVLALPFSLLSEVELDVELPPLKRQMIQTLGYGTNAKLMLQFEQRVWRVAHNASGSGFTDNGLQCVWDSSRAQPGQQGLLTVFQGGRAGLALGDDTPDAQAAQHLPQIDQIFAGTSAHYRQGSALRMHWPSMPFSKGSYACFRPGQARFSGHEATPVGQLYFAGEHTSEEFQGYMNGAVESGERAAQALLDAG